MFNEHSMEERRNFLKKSLLGIGVVICSSSLAGMISSCSNSVSPIVVGGNATLDITTTPQLLVPGGAVKKVFTGQFGNKPVLIIRLDVVAFAAFTTVCPHEGAEVSLPASSTADIVCKEHDARFSHTDGSVIEGPATRALTLFNTSFDSANNLLAISY